MCLGIPGKVLRIDGGFATVDIEGIRMRACIELIEDVRPGDYVIVHAGFAITRLDLEQAAATLELLRHFHEDS